MKIASMRQDDLAMIRLRSDVALDGPRARLVSQRGRDHLSGHAVRHPSGLELLFGDFHESLLDQLDHPGPGIGVDVDPGEQILIPPVVDARGHAA